MKAFTPTILFAIIARLSRAAPAIDTRQSTQWAKIVFEGAPPDAAQFTLWEPIDGSEFSITNPLSISHIQVYGQAICGLVGIDGSRTWVTDGESVDVGPPQTQVSGYCWPYWRK